MMLSELDYKNAQKLIEEEKREAEKIKKYKEMFTGYREIIDSFLEKSDFEQLQNYFQTEEMKAFSKMENELAIFCVMLSIYHMEVEEHLEYNIFSNIRSMSEAREYYLKVKFLIWRLEFEDNDEELEGFIKSHQVSVPFLKYLIFTSSFDKVNTSFKLAMLLKKIGKLSQAFAILNYTNELCPDEEMVFCEMAEICMNMGQYENAAFCIGRIQKPSEILIQYQRKWGI